jgi:hypothetical protein
VFLQPCVTQAEAATIVEAAKASRSVGETRANARSSRSHLILRIKVEILQLSSSLGGVEPSSGAKPVGAGSGPASVSFSLVSSVQGLQRCIRVLGEVAAAGVQRTQPCTA